MKNIEQIYGLHALGFAIHWLHAKKKNPVELGWSKGPRKTLEELKKSNKPSYNVGVRLGQPSQLIDGNYLHIIDCDLKANDANILAELTSCLDNYYSLWRSAPKVISGRGNGSFHIYFKSPTPLNSKLIHRSGHFVKVKMSGEPSERDLKNLTKDEIEQGLKWRPAWEVELLGTNKQAVIPPSIHPDSDLDYKWENEIKSVEDIPLMISKEPISGIKERNTQHKNTIFQDYDIFSLKLSNELFGKIAKMEGLENYNNDRSALLFSVIHSLIALGFNDNLILSILSDKEWDLGHVAYEHAKSHDRAKAARWLHPQITKARAQIDPKNAFIKEVKDVVLTPEESKLQESDLVSLMDRLSKTDKGAIKPTTLNTTWILSRTHDYPVFGFNEFINMEVFLAKPMWDLTGEFKPFKRIFDSDLVDIQCYISRIYQCEPPLHTISSAIDYVSRQNKFHPIKNYLNGLTWDGKPRLDDWLVDYMGAESTLFNKAVGAKTLIAAVKRIFEPGCKFDQILILEGVQGIGKSRTLRALGGNYFSDTLGDIRNKDTIQNLQGNWIIEVGELSRVKRSEVDELKEFLSRQVDQIRLPYKEKVQDFPRQCIFIGTTNEDTYLKDETGNRRFWPVRVEDIDVELIEQDRDQLWAESVVRYKLGETIWLDTPELEEAAKEVQASRYVRDERGQTAVEWINNELKNNPDGPKAFTMGEVLKGAFDLSWGRVHKAEQQSFAKAFRDAGLQRKQMKILGKKENVWFLLKKEELGTESGTEKTQ